MIKNKKTKQIDKTNANNKKTGQKFKKINILKLNYKTGERLPGRQGYGLPVASFQKVKKVITAT